MIDLSPFAFVFGAFLAAFVVSTIVIRAFIPTLQSRDADGASLKPDDPVAELMRSGRLPESSSNAIFDMKSTGFWIGFCETFLVFTLVFADAFSALAIIVGAKQFVRNEKIKSNPSYYLLGTLANLCIAILAAVSVKACLAAECWSAFIGV
ncbi:MAG: hypothetical protein AAFQ67_03825 [Pseudomonadota bacterium]